MTSIKYTITSGTAPFTAKLIGTSIPDNVHQAIGTYQFNNILNGTYSLSITDSNGCNSTTTVVVNPAIPIPQPPVTPINELIVGNANGELIVFNTDATNTTTHYDTYPANETPLCLWFKTSNGLSLTAQKVINYEINTGSVPGNLFKYLSRFDTTYVDIIETIAGPLGLISGQIILKPGFIEGGMMYNYAKNIASPDFNIILYSASAPFKTDIPIAETPYIYGISDIDTHNVIFKY